MCITLCHPLLPPMPVNENKKTIAQGWISRSIGKFLRSNRPGYPHLVSSELENSGIRVAVGDCSVNERRRWCPPYQTCKTVRVNAKHYKHNEDRRMAPGVCGNGSIPLSHSGNVVMRIGIHMDKLVCQFSLRAKGVCNIRLLTRLLANSCFPSRLPSSKMASFPDCLHDSASC